VTLYHDALATLTSWTAGGLETNEAPKGLTGARLPLANADSPVEASSMP